MPQTSSVSLWSALHNAGRLSSRVWGGAGASASWGELAAGFLPGDRIATLQNRCVLVATIDRFASAAALIQFDGVARRLVLCPPDVSQEQLGFVAEAAGADAIVTDERTLTSSVPCVEGITLSRRPIHLNLNREATERNSEVETEWILLTSGTTGRPKLVRHTLASLAGAIDRRNAPPLPMVWSTFYDIVRYGGLQIFLRAAITGTSLVLPGTGEPTADFLARAGEHGVTHISGTPSHWRRAVMSHAASRIAPGYVRLSGEIADQAILNQLRSQYPQAKVAHAFASTEAGVAFAVNDGLMGVPEDAVEHTRGVEMKVEGGTLRIRSDRTASCYLGQQSRGEHSAALKDSEGFVDTGDALELRGGRYYFVGRRDGTINVGGFKVHPEEVEMVINRHPEVGMSLVRAKKSPITGTLVVADVVLKAPARTSEEGGAPALQRDILQFCRAELPLHKVPATINFVPSLAVAETGKLIRHHA